MNIIFYGSLRDPDIRSIVLGEAALSRIQLHQLQIQGHVEYAENGEYIVLVPDSTQTCSVLLASHLSKTDVMRLDFYERGHYQAQTLQLKELNLTAYYYSQTKTSRPSGKTWDFQHWCQHHKPVFMPKLKALFAAYDETKVTEEIACLSPLWREDEHERTDIN